MAHVLVDAAPAAGWLIADTGYHADDLCKWFLPPYRHAPQRLAGMAPY